MPEEWFAFSTTKLIDAPLEEVFTWCTDYREDDPQKVHGNPDRKMRITEKSSSRIQYITKWDENGKHYAETAVITLKPPDRWYLQTTGTKWNSRGEYRLEPLGSKTKLTVTINEIYTSTPHPDPKGMSNWLSEYWDTILNAFYSDLRQGESGATGKKD